MGCSNPRRLRASALTLSPRASPPPKPPPHPGLTLNRPPARPAARSLAVLSLSLSSSSSISSVPPPAVRLCPTTALIHTRPSTLHQLLPMPGPAQDASALSRAAFDGDREA